MHSQDVDKKWVSPILFGPEFALYQLDTGFKVTTDSLRAIVGTSKPFLRSINGCRIAVAIGLARVSPVVADGRCGPAVPLRPPCR